MHNPFKRKPKPTQVERNRLLAVLGATDPTTPEYKTVADRLSEIDRVNNRTSELKKTVIPAFGSAAAIGGIYAIQQFGGVIVPKAAEALASRQEQKRNNKELD